MSRDLLPIGLAALADTSMSAVFADAVLEDGWFDARAMALLYPPMKPKASWSSAERASYRAAIERQVPMMHSRESFDAAAGRASEGWVRACVAVLLFGGWQKGRWQIKTTMMLRERSAIPRRYPDASVTVRVGNDEHRVRADIELMRRSPRKGTA